MSNNVYNTMTITGLSGFITNFKFEMSKPRPYDIKEEHTTRRPQDPLRLGYVSKPFTFWNVIAPPEETFERYFSICGWTGGVNYGDDDDQNWYNWNMANWGTKWDAHDIRVVEDYELPDGKAEWIIDFNTANTIPSPVFQALAIKYPELTFNVKSIEEEGWGQSAIHTGGRLIDFKEWDIPKTHGEAQRVWGECPCLNNQWSYKDCVKING